MMGIDELNKGRFNAGALVKTWLDLHWSLEKELTNPLKAKILVIQMLSGVSEIDLITLFGTERA